MSRHGPYRGTVIIPADRGYQRSTPHLYLDCAQYAAHMPVKMHHTAEGWYYQWGEHGKKYFFNPDDPESKTRAKENAARQGRAAFAHGYRGKK